MNECITQFENIWSIVSSPFTDTTSPRQKVDAVLKQYQKQLEHIKVTDKAIDDLAISIYDDLTDKLRLTDEEAMQIGLTEDNIKEVILQKEALLEEAPRENENNVVDKGLEQSKTTLYSAINDVFGVHETAGDVLNEFLEGFTKAVIWNPETGKSPANEEEMNVAIQDLQQSMYDNVSQYLNTQGEKLPLWFYNKDGSNNFGSIYGPMEVVLNNITPLGIRNLKLSNRRQDETKLRAIKSYFQLRYFDSFLLSNYKDSFQLRSPSFSGRFTTEQKYVFNTKSDQQQAKGWFDSDIKAPKDIMSKRVQNLYKLIPYLKNGNPYKSMRLNTDRVSYAKRSLIDALRNGKGKNILAIDNFIIQDYNFTQQELNFLRERFGSRNKDTGRIEIVKDKVDLEQILAVARYNIIDGYSILFKMLSKGDNLSKLGLTDRAVDVLYSLHRYIFDDVNNPNSLKLTNSSLFEEVVHSFDNDSYITTGKYSENENGMWGINEMSPINDQVIEGQMKDSINSIYDPISVEVLTKKYSITEHFNEDKPEDSYIQFEIKNSPDLESYLIKVYTHQNYSQKQKVKVFRKIKNQVDERYNKVTQYTKEDFNSLLGFIKDTLGEHLGKDDALREELFRDTGSSNEIMAMNKVLKSIIPLASMTLSVGKLLRSFNSDGSTPIKQEYQEKGQQWGLIDYGTKEKKQTPKIRYYSGYEGYDVIHSSYLGYVKTLAKCKAMVNDMYSRSTMRTSEKTNIPVNKLPHVNADRRTAIVGQIETERSALNLGNNRYLTDDIQKWSTSREAKTASGGKQNVNFNFNESLFSAFCLDFLTGYVKGGKHYYQFTEATVSDKPNVPKISVQLVDKLSIDDLKKMTVIDFGQVYRNIWKNIKKDFDTLQQFIDNKPIEYKGFVIDGSLKIDCSDNFVEFNKWVETNISKDSGITGHDILNKICLEYNKKHRFNPIEINENVHKRDGSNGLELNKGYISELMRFNRDQNMMLLPELSDLQGLSDLWMADSYWWNQQNTNNYFTKNDLRLVDDLISNRANINIKHDSGKLKKHTWATKLASVGEGKWYKHNGDVIFAKVIMKDGTEVNVSDSYDLSGYTTKDGRFIEFIDGGDFTSDDARFNFETLNHEKVKNKNGIARIEVNPLLRKWNVADFYYSSKSTMGTVGASFWCDAKKAKNTNYEVENAQNDFQKRNVTQTATVNQFMLGSLNGIASLANVVVFKQPSTIVSNILGDSGKIDYWDGATYTSAFQNYWENGSLANAVTGKTKKPIMHFYNEKFALAQLNKTAAFAITNKWMRESMFIRKLHYKSTKDTWLKRNGYEISADITKYYTWNETLGKYDVHDIDYSDCYYQRNGSYYKIDRLERIPDPVDENNNVIPENRYNVYVKAVDVRGNELPGEETKKFVRTINSNYRLWEVLGGTGSVELDETTGKFIDSEHSIEKVAQVACKVGQRLVRSGNITSQSSIFQFMKHSDKHYIVTDGAFKKAPGNLNSFEQLKNNEDLNFIRVNMTYSGIQLDPTHQADNSTVSLMTQVMSALADRGYTKEYADQVYSALGEITREAIEPFFDAYSVLLKTKSKDSIVNLISEQIVDSFKGSKINSDNLLQTISLNLYNLIQQRGKGNITSESLEGLVPWSENSVGNLINSTVTSTINKLGIRIKTFGTLSVLNPSHGTIQLYGNKKLSEFTSAYDFYHNGTKMWDNKITNHSFRIGRHYRYKEGNEFKNIQLSLANYYDFIGNIDNGIYTDVSETYLGKETTVLQGDDVYDINMSEPYFGLVKYYRTEEDAKNGNASYEFSTSQLKRTYVEGNETKNIYKIVTVELLGRDLDTYNVFLNEGKYNVLDLESVHRKRQLHIDNEKYKQYKKEINSLLDLQKIGTITNEQLIRLNNLQQEMPYLQQQATNVSQKIHDINRDIQRDFVSIVNNGTINIYDAKSNSIKSVKISDHETHSYGILLPMIYKLKFGLRDGDNLSDILGDPDFFFRRLLQEYYDLDLGKKTVSYRNYDIILRRTGGRNIYLKLKDGKPIDASLREVFINKSHDQKGNLWREDGERNSIHKLSSESDIIYQDLDNRNKGEVIFTDAEGLKFYINEFKNDIFDVQVKNSKEVTKEHLDLLEDTIKETEYGKSLGKNFSIKWLMFDHTDEISKFAINGQSLEQSGLYDKIEKNHKLSTLYKQSQRMYVAFQKSLETLAARIPSQGMASFMTMKVEGFTNVDVNDCFISDMQIWLQGSDFDVDKVTVMGCAFTNSGRYIKWSKYMVDDTLKALNITSKLKFPTGRKTIVSDGEETFEEFKSLFKNNKLNLKNNDGTYNEDKLELLVKMINKYDHNLSGKKGDLRDNIQRVVDEHNLTDFKDYKQEALSNLIQHVSTRVSKSLLNAVASQQSTDDVSEPLKELAEQSPFGTKDNQNRYGNAVVKIKQMISNQTGKSGIAVTASVGIKAFFAITQYFNTKLANAKTTEDILKYKFNVTIDETNYNTIANIRIDENILNDWLKSDNKELVEMAKSIKQNDAVDADTTISGIMTLAVDNAKLLTLAKLNASTDILGLYLYGVSIGVPFENLVRIFTSNVADVLNQNLKGNIFNGTDDVRLGFAISKLEKGPYISREILNNEKSSVNKLLLKKDKNNQYDSIADMILGENGVIKTAETLYNDPNDSMRFARRRFYIIDQFNKIKGMLRDLYKQNNDYDKRLVNNTYEYLDQIYRMYGNGKIEETNKILADIKTLYEGKKELSNLKNMILNQGVKVLENEQLAWIDTFSNTIKSRLKGGKYPSEVETFRSLNSDNSVRIDILKYATNDEYRQAAIDAYGSVKHTINILEVIDSLPHFREYLKGYAASNIAKLNSSKYEAKSKVSNMLFDVYGIKTLKDKEAMLKRVDDFLSGIIYDQFLKSSTVPVIRIEEGATIISSTGQPIILDSPTSIQLGTDLGNTNFKLWVENTVLPTLQSSRYGNNSFISDLSPRRYKFTQFGNLVRGLSLPIDMIAKSDSEKILLDKYKYDFGELTDMYKNSGLSIQEIFYLYNLLTYQNKLNTRALTPITDVLYVSKNSIADKASKFISNFDKNSRLVNDDIYSELGDISPYFTKENLIQAAAPSTREVNLRYYDGPYLRMFNYKTLQWELLKRKPEAKDNEEAKNYRSNFEEDIVDDELEQLRAEQRMEQEQNAEDDAEHMDEESTGDENEEQNKKNRDIYENYEQINSVREIGISGNILSTLGKLPRDEYFTTEFLPFNTRNAKLNDTTFIDVDNEGKVFVRNFVENNNNREVREFEIIPLSATKIIDRNPVKVVDRLDLEVKINKILKPCA